MLFYISVKVEDFRYTMLTKLNFFPEVVIKFGCEECVFDDWERGFCCACLFVCDEDNSLLKKKTIIISVFDGRCSLGSAYIDVGSVWDMEGHQLCRKWVPLTLGNGAHENIVGYTQACVSISKEVSQHECQKFDVAQEEETIEQNLMVPVKLVHGQKLAVYCLHVYRAEGIPSIYNRLDLSVRGYLAGITAETSKSCVKNNSVTWNEALVFTDVVPCFYPFLRVELTWQNVVISVLHIDFHTLLEGAPKFGPNMVHMYSKKVTEHGKLYSGCLLLTFKRMEYTEGVKYDFILPPLEDEDLGKVELALVGEIHDAVLFDKEISGQPVKLEVSMGETGGNFRDGFASGETLPSFACLYPEKSVRVGTSHMYLSCNENEGTVYLKKEWADSLYRLYRTNHLENITKNLIQLVGKLRGNIGNNNSEAIVTLQSGFRKLSDDCESYLKAYSHLPPKGNELDCWRQKLHLEELTCIKQEADKLTGNSKIVAQEGLSWARKILQTLEFLTEDPQHSLPDVVLSLWVGKSRFAYCRILARQVLHSNITYEQGSMCGTISSLMLEHLSSRKVMATVDVKLWLGNITVWNNSQKWEHFAHSTIGLEDFSLLATICQAYSLNSKVLRNAYVTVSVRQHSKHTQVQPGDFQLRWNESLWFTNIRFNDLPPTVVLELWTRSMCVGDSCFGNVILKPTVSRLTDCLPTASLLSKFTWHNLIRDDKIVGQVFAVFHLQQEDSNELHSLTVESKNKLTDISSDVEQYYRLEVLLWGLRDVKIPHWRTITSRTVTIRFAGHEIKDKFEHPGIIQNFPSHDLRTVDLVLPRENFPPLRITLKDTHSMFGSNFRHHTVENMEDYRIQLIPRQDFESAFHGPLLFSTAKPPASDQSPLADPTEETVTLDMAEEKLQTRGAMLKKFFSKETPLLPAVKRLISKVHQVIDSMRETRPVLPPAWRQDVNNIVDREARFDWWTKYFGTIAVMQEVTKILLPETEDELIVPVKKEMIKIYSEELEKQPEFGGFFDNMKIFPLTREDHISGYFKGALRLYRMPVEGLVLHDGSVPGTRYPSNKSVDLLVRIYVVRAISLAAKDITGSSDPYLVIGTSIREGLINDRENYIPVTTDPIFGRMFELELSLPEDYLLNISVMDRDEVKWDDLIGITSIDIENRYYSRHRATRGISSTYREDGYMKWRDTEKPTDILMNLCEHYNIQGPVYTTDHVILGSWDGQPGNEPDPIKKEELALAALNQWETIPLLGCKLVPEHVETRVLYHPNLTGETQGMLQLWVDIFDSTQDIPPEINIVPRHPEPYELRVTVWDTHDMALHDYSIISGSYSSDIYVLGWLCKEKTTQKTDIHYRSLTGEGNFNYRLIFNFDYWSAEGKISLPKKSTTAQPQKPRIKFPCILVMEAWDNNHIFRDDKLGILKLNLLRVPQGARSSRLCTLETLGLKTLTTDLFVQKRTRGWWPFQVESEDGPKLTGKIDMELELLPKEEAEAYPAGLGRSAPNPLEKPARPETSFDWIRHPLKALYYSMWLENRTKLLKLLLYALAVYIALRFLVTLPDIISSLIAKKFSGC